MNFVALTAAFLLSFFFGITYTIIIYSLDRFEKEPALLVTVVFVWGAVVATIGAIILELIFGVGIGVFTSSQLLTDLFNGSVSAPFAEELLKSAAVLVVFLFFKKEFDSVLDGVVYASVVALGFAATENMLYLFSNYVKEGWDGLLALFVLRVLLNAWAHPLYTCFFGITLAMARLNRNWFVKIFLPLAGLSLGMFIHGLDNGLLTVLPGLPALVTTFGINWLGWFGIIIVIIWANWRESKWIEEYLKDELNQSIITPNQYKTASNLWRQFLAWFKALTSGQLGSTNRFYQVCGELAHKKRQFLTMGEEDGNLEMINKYRQELFTLSPKAQA
jgi:RsiW-degrading membrane proteinase PrsW (M82 family)